AGGGLPTNDPFRIAIRVPLLADLDSESGVGEDLLSVVHIPARDVGHRLSVTVDQLLVGLRELLDFPILDRGRHVRVPNGGGDRPAVDLTVVPPANGLVVHRLLALGVPHPYGRRRLRNESDEPGVPVLVRGTGLSRRG